MRTRRGKPADGATVKSGGIRKPQAKRAAPKAIKGAAVITKRVALTRRPGSGRGASSQQQAADRGSRRTTRVSEHSEPQHDEQEQQEDEPPPQQQPAAAAVKRQRRSLAGAEPDTSIEQLSTEALQEVFLHLSQQEQQSYCREVLPLVCKRFRDVLLEPSAVWESLHIDFIHKGQDLAFPEQAAAAGGDGSNRRLLHSTVERWLKPRAAAVKRLVLSFSARDQTHSFPKHGHGLRAIFQLLAPTLQELCIAHCSDIFHAASFADVAQLKCLESLAITFATGSIGRGDLATLEGLKHLRSLTLSASRGAEEGGPPCLAGFPDTLLKLKGLTSLSISSQGVASLPVGITKLKKLECLDVSGCPLPFLPTQLWKLAALRHLRLNGTALMPGMAFTWEPLAKLPALESVEMRDTKARKLPPALNGLAALTCLDLSDNAFDGLQEGDLGALAGLPNLQRLLLRCCQLPSVPGELAALTGLTHLDLSRNQLVELPPALEALGGLRELVAEGNCFPRIPQVLGQLAALEACDLSFNIYMEAAVSLQPLLEGGGLAALKRLDLRKMLGVWKQSSIKWLRALVAELEQRHAEAGGGRGSAPVVLWD